MSATLLCYGDSNTHGTMPMASLLERGRFGRETRWPGVLRAALPGVEVIEEGLPGRTTLHADPVEGAHLDGLAMLPAVLASHRPLDMVILSLGTNDLKRRFCMGPLDIALSILRLAGTVLASDAGPGGGAPQVLAVLPPPILEVGCLAPMFLGGAAVSREVAHHLVPLATAAGVPVLEAGRHIAVDPLDGIHYDPEAHAALGRAVAAKIGPALGRGE